MRWGGGKDVENNIRFSIMLSFVFDVDVFESRDGDWKGVVDYVN